MAANARTLFAALAAVTALLAAAPAGAALSAPTPLAPAAGDTVDSLPAFAWSPVVGADKYEFQIAADPGFNSPVLGRGEDDFFTRNARATLKKTVPNGLYYWRVRAVTQSGGLSGWSSTRSLRKSWSAATALQTPTGGASLNFPNDALQLNWSAVPGAANYLVSVATDPTLGSLVVHDQYDLNGPPKVQATTLATGATLAPGTYYWSVTPVDAEGNRGVPSPVASFNWGWPSAMTPRVTDLNSASEVFDPQFSWDPVPGAARYEVEVNPSADFAPGSKVCCDGTTIATSLAPTKLFKDNTFYWRVRAIDPDGNAGVWSNGPSFNKTFDKVPPVDAPSVKNLHLRDNVDDPGVDQNSGSAGYQTQVPVVTWDPVPGASSYEVDVTPYQSGMCNWTAPELDGHWRVETATNAWTPLGSSWNNVKPYPDNFNVAQDFVPLLAQQYCVRVRARSDRAGSGFDEVYGDYTYLDPNMLGWAFEWTSYPTGSSCSPSCSTGYLGANDYQWPLTGTTTGRTPYFTWKPLSGKQSYFVLVSKDPSFSNIVDYAFTRIPAYAPRGPFGATTYSDETTLYYWAVLPATGSDGSGGSGNPLLAAARNFQKQSTPPALLSPAPGGVFLDQPTFRWTPAEGARYYRLQVAQDPSFGSPIDDVKTDSTSYSSNTTYPADTVLYWRVRAADENEVGLTWSATGTFQKKLAAPVPSASNPTSGEFLPVWSWGSVNGAVSYDIAIDGPDGQHHDYSGFRIPAVSFQKLTGTGVFHWRVRAEFSKQGYGSVPGPYSPSMSFTRTIGEPTGLKTDGAPDHLLLSWSPKLGVKSYRVEIASRQDFAQTVETVSTDNTSYAPALTDIAYLNGGQLWWRVAGVDSDGNVGDFSRAQGISLLPKMKLKVSGKLKRKRTSVVTARVTNASGTWMTRVSVRVSGAGLRARTKATNVVGNASFRLRPTKKGRVLFRATKKGYQPAELLVIIK